jgi:hypothetical protein
VLAAAGFLAAPSAIADPQALQFGQMTELSDMGGTIDYTVSNLRPSGHNDGVWYSDVTAEGVSGNATPNIADFNARAVNSSTFAVMKGNQTDGLPEGPLPLGTAVTGRIYFDVRNGTNPDSVVYRDAGGTDKVVWTS